MTGIKLALVSRFSISVSFAAVLLVFPSSYLQARTVSVASAAPDPMPVGTMVTWVANADGGSSGNLWYRFRIRYAGTVPAACAAAGRVRVHSRCLSNDFVTVRDYGPDNSLDWTA